MMAARDRVVWVVGELCATYHMLEPCSDLVARVRSDDRL